MLDRSGRSTSGDHCWSAPVSRGVRVSSVLNLGVFVRCVLISSFCCLGGKWDRLGPWGSRIISARIGNGPVWVSKRLFISNDYLLSSLMSGTMFVLHLSGRNRELTALFETPLFHPQGLFASPSHAHRVQLSQLAH